MKVSWDRYARIVDDALDEAEARVGGFAHVAPVYTSDGLLAHYASIRFNAPWCSRLAEPGMDPVLVVMNTWDGELVQEWHERLSESQCEHLVLVLAGPTDPLPGYVYAAGTYHEPDSVEWPWGAIERRLLSSRVDLDGFGGGAA